MKFDYLKGKSGFISVLLLGTSAFSAVLTTVKVTDLFATSARAENLVEKVVSQNKKDAEDIEKYFAANKAIADELKKNNLFAPTPPKQHPVTQVLGILGDEVLIKDKWYKAGDMVADATIVAVEPTEVRIEWQGGGKIFSPIDSSKPDGAGGQPGSRRTRGTTAKKEIRTGQAAMVVFGTEKRSPGEKGPYKKLSGKEKAKLQLTAEQKQRLLAEKEMHRKLASREAEKIKAQQKKIAAQKKYTSQQKKNATQKKYTSQKKTTGYTKPKKEATQRKIKK